MMFRFLLFLILFFNFQSLTNASVFKKFDIAGMTIGKSLLNFYDKKEILINRKFKYKDKKISTSEFENFFYIPKTKNSSIKYKNFIFDKINISYFTKDKKFKIINISGIINLDRNKNDCEEKSFEFVNYVKTTLHDAKYTYEAKTNFIPIDFSKKSILTSNHFYLENKDSIIIECYYFSRSMRSYSNDLRFRLSTDSFNKWLLDEAFK